MSTSWTRQHQARNFYGREQPTLPKSRNDLDVLIERHRFIRDADEGGLDWEDQLAKRAYDQLFKEFAVCDLSRYEEGKVAMRWRVASEVVAGRGHLSCGNLRCKYHHEVPTEGEIPVSGEPMPSTSSRPSKRKKARELQTLTTSFAYAEAGQQKVAEVTLVLCGKCAKKLALGKGGEAKARSSAGATAEVDHGSSQGRAMRVGDETREERPRRRSSRSASPTLRSQRKDTRSKREDRGDGKAQDKDRSKGAVSRDEAGIYIADGFGNYGKTTQVEDEPSRERRTEKTHPSTYTSLVNRWKR